jgi:hypothetical protein
MESSPASNTRVGVIFEVNVGSGSQQLLDAVEIALLGCEMESSLSLVILEVDLGSGILQRWDAFGMAATDCEMERSLSRSLSSLILGVDVYSWRLQ